jgi:hypothetical protein
MHAEGFDLLTWRKGPEQNIDSDLFVKVRFIEETGPEHRGGSRTPPWTCQSRTRRCSRCAKSASTVANKQAPQGQARTDLDAADPHPDHRH